MRKLFYVYIVGSKSLTLYIGVTSNLAKRVYQHRKGFVSGFTKKYNVKELLYYEVFEGADEAIKREKQLKNWHREWKLNLIKSKNPSFEDLYKEILK